MPLANHRSFAACTRAAADNDGVTISIPCTGVKDSEVEVPDFASAEVVLRPSICVRILFARDNLASNQRFSLNRGHSTHLSISRLPFRLGPSLLYRSYPVQRSRRRRPSLLRPFQTPSCSAIFEVQSGRRPPFAFALCSSVLFNTFTKPTHRLPPRFFLFVSCGIGRAFVNLLGGGSAIFWIRFVNSASIFLP